MENSGRLRTATLVLTLMIAGSIVAACVPPGGGGGSIWVGADCGAAPSILPGASLFGCNLAGFDLSGLDLSGADLRGANLGGADLSNSDLSGANLTGANLTGANLSGANLTGAILAGAILIGALFVGSILTGTNFDFGTAYGPGGNGGGGPSGPSCVGEHCPGYNGANVDTGHPLCDAEISSTVGGDWFFVHRTPAQLQALGLRSVVVDSTTSFAGAVFDYSGQPLPAIVTMRGLDWSSADFTGATFINTGFGCQVGSGARFSGATFISTGVAADASHWYSVAFTDSDFSDTTWTGVVMSTIDFTGSDFSGATIDNWGMENQIDFNDDGIADRDWETPPMLMRLDDTDFTGAQLGLGVNPGTGSNQMVLSGNFNDTVYTSVSFAGADLSGAKLANFVMRHADLTGVTAVGTEIYGPSYFGFTDFTGGWAGAIWVDGPGGYEFSSATCPDGTLFDDEAPCLG